MCPPFHFNVHREPSMALSAEVINRRIASYVGAGVIGGGAGVLPVAANNRVAWFGDSRTQIISATRPDASILLACGQAQWALHGTNYRWRTPRGNNFGVGGDDTNQMVARLAEVVASPCSVVVFLGGVNDGLNLTISQTIANYTTILNALRDAGSSAMSFPIRP
jgi:lysophospholipase L1-like esterase